MTPRLIIAGLGLIALAGCAGQSATTTVATDAAAATTFISNVNADASTALTVAEASLAAYAATSNPNKAVLAEATKLDKQARALITQYGTAAPIAIAATASLAEYLLTSAPGNGVTPSTVPIVQVSGLTGVISGADLSVVPAISVVGSN